MDLNYVLTRDDCYSVPELVLMFEKNRLDLYTLMKRRSVPKLKIGKEVFFSKVAVQRVYKDLQKPRVLGLENERKANDWIFRCIDNQPVVSFKGGDIDAKQAFNLLAGRSVEMPDGSWMQLDFNDKDAEGSFKTKIFPASLGYDITLAIEKLKTSAGLTWRIFKA